MTGARPALSLNFLRALVWRRRLRLQGGQPAAVTVQDLLELHGDASLVVLLLVLSVLTVTPLAGVGTVLSFAIFAIAWRRACGREGRTNLPFEKSLHNIALSPEWGERTLRFLATPLCPGGPLAPPSLARRFPCTLDAVVGRVDCCDGSHHLFAAATGQHASELEFGAPLPGMDVPRRLGVPRRIAGGCSGDGLQRRIWPFGMGHGFAVAGRGAELAGTVVFVVLCSTASRGATGFRAWRARDRQRPMRRQTGSW